MTDEDAVIRAEILVSAVRITLEDTVGDPDALVRLVADKTLDDIRRSMWWATLLDAARIKDLDRAAVAAVVLIFGEPPTLTSYGWAA